MSDNDTQLDTPTESEPYQDFGSLDAAETVHTVDSDAAQDIADYNAEADDAESTCSGDAAPSTVEGSRHG